MSVWDGEDRFSLLLLEEDEYYFRDHSCLFWKGGDTRIPGQLKVCSAALYFVPRAVQEPIFRVPYRSTSHIERVWDEEHFLNDDTFYITASERIDMRKLDRNVPYICSVGLFEFRFQLVYTSLEEVLPKIQRLWDVAQQSASKEGHIVAKQRLAEIIQAHEESERFNPGWLEDENERLLLELLGRCITPLCSQPGRVALTATRIYFQPFNVASNSPIQTYHLSKAQSLIKRTYLLKNIGLEIFFSGSNSLYLTFKSAKERDKLAGLLEQQSDLKLQKRRSKRQWRRDWQNGRVSNFEYIMFLNREAGRSFKDLTQYPVFPWIIQDYSSSALDLSDPATFRDLSKPIGALNPRRLRDFLERFKEQKSMNQWNQTKFSGVAAPLDDPPFLYGCHYSTPGYVVFYLMRSHPEYMLRLQNGRFDAPDRLFFSIKDTWDSVMTLPTDVKELIPEFYSDASFLVNTEELDYGVRSSGPRVNDVELPPWATDAADFVAKLANALECQYVSQRLHHWIDLIFGYKSRGAAAEKADNLFHYLTYDDTALELLEKETQGVVREAWRVQMMEFGRTPKQLYTEPHPRRRPTCCSCFSPGPGHAQSARPANVLHPTLVQGSTRQASAVSKAVERLTSRKQTIREATLQWLEAAARTREPEYMLLSGHTKLLPLIKATQRAELQATEMKEVFGRALRALAVAPLNCSLILDAGGLGPLTDMLCGRNADLAHQAVVVFSLLTKEDDQRLKAMPSRTVEHVLALLPASVGNTPRDAAANDRGNASDLTGADVRMAAAATVANLSQSLPNRNTICGLGGPMMLLAVAQQEDEVPTVRREAVTALVVLLEDDTRKEELAERGGLQVLVQLAQTDDVVLRDLRVASMRCLASLSTADALKPRLAAAGLPSLLYSAARPSGEPTADAELQQPAAAALANLCSNPVLADQIVREDGMTALTQLAASPDREVQRHTARAFWHLSAMEGAVGEAISQSNSLAALLRLAAREGNTASQMARKALKRLSEDPAVSAALVAEVAKGGPGLPPAVYKTPSLYLQKLLGTPTTSGYNTPAETPSGTPLNSSVASPFRSPSSLRHHGSSATDLSNSVPQGSPLNMPRRHHRRMSSLSNNNDADGGAARSPLNKVSSPVAAANKPSAASPEPVPVSSAATTAAASGEPLTACVRLPGAAVEAASTGSSSAAAQGAPASRPEGPSSNTAVGNGGLSSSANGHVGQPPVDSGEDVSAAADAAASSSTSGSRPADGSANGATDAQMAGDAGQSKDGLYADSGQEHRKAPAEMWKESMLAAETEMDGSGS